MKIGIIGGTDGLGHTLNFYFKDEFDVYISGRDHKKGRKVASQLNVNYIESNTQLASECDIVIVSVPIQFTEDVIKEIAPYMQPGSLLCDITSVKEEPSKAMSEYLSDEVNLFQHIQFLVHVQLN